MKRVNGAHATCLRKKWYPTIRAARKAAEGHLQGSGWRERPYKCDVCGGFHTSTDRVAATRGEAVNG